MTKTVILSVCLAASLLSLNARAQDERQYTEGPVTDVNYNIILMITYKNMAALDKGVEQEAVAKKVIGGTELQNKARVARNEYRKNVGTELIRELILK